MRKKKSFIATINGDSGVAISQENKLSLAFHHFSNLLGTQSERTRAINWNDLGYEQYDLDELDAHLLLHKRLKL
jgi:hypothetical protein